MEATKSTLRGTILLVLSFSLFALIIGCSNNSPFSVDNSSIDIPPPPLTGENIANGPAPGYSYLPLEVTEIFGGIAVDGPMYTEQVVFDDQGGAVYFPSSGGIGFGSQVMDWWHGVIIDADDIHETIRVSMLVPDPSIAAVDFGPHPYQFDGEVRIELVYTPSNLELIGATPRDLVIMWWNNTVGEYQPIPSTLNQRENKLYGFTDHFSRYIIANGGGD